MNIDLTGKVAIVTGAARGIGAEIVNVLSKAGASVIAADIQTEQILHNIVEIKGIGNDNIDISPVVTDVTNLESIQNCIQFTKEKYGKLDILINNAGIGVRAGFEELTLEEWDQTLNTNLRSVMFFSKESFPLLKQSEAGRIINISSLAGRVGGIHSRSDYVASKTGVIGLTKNLAGHAAPHGITVNAIAPGVIQTPMTEGYPEESISKIPLGRIGQPIDIANAALFLASDLASFITGVTIDVNGGMYMG